VFKGHSAVCALQLSLLHKLLEEPIKQQRTFIISIPRSHAIYSSCVKNKMKGLSGAGFFPI
jgi:hypothetical protein